MAKRRRKKRPPVLIPQPQELSLGVVFDLLKAAAFKSNQDNCAGLAKEAAYSFILSFFPMLVAFVAFFFISGNAGRVIIELLGTLKRLLPDESYQVIEDYLRAMELSTANTKLFWISILGAIWSASGVMSSLQTAFNTIYGVKSRRNFWERQVMSIILVITVGLPMIILSAITIFSQQVDRYLIQYEHVDRVWVYSWSILRWVIGLITIISMAIILYRVGTEYKQRWREVLPGAVLATALWVGVTKLFNLYVQHFNSYNKIYGSLGAVILLLIWMFLTAYVLLYGAEFNFQYQHRFKPKLPE